AVLLDGKVTVAELRELATIGVPVVMVGEPMDGPCPPKISSVSVDIASVMRLAVSHLTSLGHRSIAFYSHRGSHYFDQLNLAFHQCMAEAGLAQQAMLWQLRELPYEGSAIPDLLGTMPSPPTAIIVEETSRAATIVQRLNEHGWKVPDRMSVLAITAGPDRTGLTRIFAPWNQMVRQAAALADLIVRSPAPVSRTERIAPMFVPGTTCRLLTDANRAG